MRDYGKVFSRIWESSDFRSLSEDGRALVLYLLTCQHGTLVGVFRVPDGYACEDLQWTPERVAKAFSETLSRGFANRCETTKWVWVVKFLEWNPPENPNQRKAAAKIINGVPAECVWKRDFMRVCGPLIDLEQPSSPNPLPTVPEPLLNQYQEQKQEQKKAAAQPLALPDWLPKPAWDGFVEMRKKVRKPMTDRAMELMVAKLRRFHEAGHDVGTVLENSTASSWTDLYEPKGRPAPSSLFTGAV